MRKTCFKLTGLVLLLLVALLPATAFAADWPQFHNTLDSNGYSTSGAPDTNNILWESENIGANMSSSPVIAGGRVYVYCCQGGEGGFSADSSSVACLNEDNGDKLWETTVETAQWGSWSSPAYDNGKVYIGSGETAYCLNATTGGILWSYPLDWQVVNGSPRVADGKAFFTDWDGNHGGTTYCYAFNATSATTTGELLWKAPMSGDSQATPAYNNGRVYVCSWNYVDGPGSGANNIYCLNAATGAQIWYQNGLNHDTCGAVSVGGGRVFVNTYNFYGDGELAALDENDGHVLWVAVGPDDAGTHPGLNEVVVPVPIQRSDTTPAYHDGRLYLCGGCAGFSDQNTYCFDAATGAFIWQEPASLGLTVGNWTCSVAVADGKVFTGKPGDFFDYAGLYCLNAGDGSLLWSSDKGGSSPAVADGKVFSCSGGRVYAFGASSPPVTYGDVNGDGSVTSADATLVLRYYAGLVTLTPAQLTAGDVNGDGSVTSADATLILRYYAGLITEFPVQ